MLILSLNTSSLNTNDTDYNICKNSIEWRNINVNFIDNSTKITSIHSVIKKRPLSVAKRTDDDHFSIINTIELPIHLIRCYNYYPQNQYSINDFVFEFLQAADLIVHFLFLVQFKLIIEINDRSYTIKVHRVCYYFRLRRSCSEPLSLSFSEVLFWFTIRLPLKRWVFALFLNMEVIRRNATNNMKSVVLYVFSQKCATWTELFFLPNAVHQLHSLCTGTRTDCSWPSQQRIRLKIAL